MKGWKIFVILVIVALVLVEFSDAAYRKRSGSNKSNSKSSGRSKSASRRRSTSRSNQRNRRSFSPAGTSRVTKHTYIPVSTYKSPVIVRQTRLGHRSNLGRNVFIGYMFYRYGLHSAPVYRHRYPIHRSTVEIPDERALRIGFTKEIMLDSDGKVCLNSSRNYTLVPDKNERVSLVSTSVRYSDLYGGRKYTEYFGDNKTVSVDMNALDQSVEVSTLVKYNGSIVENTNCTQIQSVMNGTVVRMYATNPDSAVSIQSSFLAVVLSSFIYCILWY